MATGVRRTLRPDRLLQVKSPWGRADTSGVMTSHVMYRVLFIVKNGESAGLKVRKENDILRSFLKSHHTVV